MTTQMNLLKTLSSGGMRFRSTGRFTIAFLTLFLGFTACFTPTPQSDAKESGVPGSRQIGSGDLQAGLDAYEYGDYAVAYRILLPLAEHGNSFAQTLLGRMHEQGQGVRVDIREAAYWYCRAAEQGIAAAQFSLGTLYDAGEGVTKDPRKAVMWYRRAAEQGNADAQFALALKYANTGPDREVAKWSRRAAEQGHVMAQLALGGLYTEGRGVPKDYVRAYAWYNLAVAQGAEILFNFVGGERISVREFAREKRDSLRSGMTSSQISKAEELSHSLLRRIEAE